MTDLQLGLEAANRAVQNDTLHNYTDALYAYESAINHMHRALSVEIDPQRQFIISSKIKEYQARCTHIREHAVRSNAKNPLEEATNIAVQATTADNDGRLDDAVRLYGQACQLFSDILRSSDIADPSKQKMREMVGAYNVRAEQIRQQQTQQSSIMQKIPFSMQQQGGDGKYHDPLYKPSFSDKFRNYTGL
eukprot:TRINITY_DN4728_c0_g1_i2.p1 TRINITY_DN4728_c0_g1~~TRINITY_DN4728_c0_g1_i2.p1  ORF type:complete len:191 (-),score=49.62 TRINITY_DN4728_c0_g1_i2:89-661(-)